ncbi:MAG: enoyl-CoA hydratase/isomerase family protein [Candidatus Nanopelagicales bacterium]
MDDTPMHLRVDRRPDGLAVLTLDYPERRNAMSDAMTASWARAVAELRADRDVRAVLVTGAGGAFCSGGDTGWIGGDPDATVAELRDKMLPFYRTWLGIRELEVPTMAAIDGPAIGAGAALALACDVRVASERAVFAVPFLRLGIHPGMGTTMLLRSVAGDAMARDLLLTGRRIGAADMLRTGIVTDVLAGEDFVATAVERAALMAAGAPIATRLTTVALRRQPTSLAEAIDWEALAQPITMATEDLHEGLAAQRERRVPEFRGR